MKRKRKKSLLDIQNNWKKSPINRVWQNRKIERKQNINFQLWTKKSDFKDKDWNLPYERDDEENLFKEGWWMIKEKFFFVAHPTTLPVTLQFMIYDVILFFFSFFFFSFVEMGDMVFLSSKCASLCPFFFLLKIKRM